MLFAFEYDEWRNIVTELFNSFRHGNGLAIGGEGDDRVVEKVDRNEALVTPDTDNESCLVHDPLIAVLLISFT